LQAHRIVESDGSFNLGTNVCAGCDASREDSAGTWCADFAAFNGECCGIPCQFRSGSRFQARDHLCFTFRKRESRERALRIFFDSDCEKFLRNAHSLAARQDCSFERAALRIKRRNALCEPRDFADRCATRGNEFLLSCTLVFGLISECRRFGDFFGQCASLALRECQLSFVFRARLPRLDAALKIQLRAITLQRCDLHLRIRGTESGFAIAERKSFVFTRE
jgi:hypothetical protein